MAGSGPGAPLVTNPAMAPRSPKCRLCREVTAIEHVAMLMWDEDLAPLPAKPATDYLMAIGMAGPPQTLGKRVQAHRKHVEAWMERGAVVAPAHSDGNVVVVPPPSGPQRWIDVNQNAINLGNDALRDLSIRLQSGALEPNEILALAKLGVNAANTRGAMEQKGKALTGIDKLLQLAAGGMNKA